ncbi:MAG TPA: hypothetical protein VJR89_02095 [Polyangiales bacterium]|nr:hypothetical protein [Polyangiales bacterium]
MQKYYLMLILLATLIIPLRNARHANVAEGLRKTIQQMALFVLIWGLGCVYVYWRLPQ